MYLVYAINGLSYANDFLKFGAMCVLFPAFEGIINWRSAQPHELWAYGWMVLRLTLPIATLVGRS